MYEYKFIEVKGSVWTSQPKTSLESITHEYARKGWRLVQVITPPYGSSTWKLIFERKTAAAGG